MQPMSESTIAMISPPTTAARRATSAKVALFIPSLHGGGAERVMVSLANGLAAKGLDVDLVLARKAGLYLHDVASGVRHVNLAAPRTRPPIETEACRERELQSRETPVV